ncbi:hypothetical protein Aaci_0684 [Alicyclobacillus acidocaldarius subsp. acidocaldarius DSM 446]|uniref:Uncharacterized protein n=1 Tax=Alicyclobacillus acidocaldarius subsp. acidocaldarius (strain ATCC 27009 / DSM 446 / BCRC 14685 / JCM 5260 / KCTC 1825 / NBRC 15652 / NCIMB 11725 / NRRL B-14509 / 104-IA) TaxID=521098 RepID=C8WTI9_ALIAD|nr:hypothetical protein Aaci_0684 [Alicyclobacillus acidocaldarius subsp. acidocaldarius DSM 446]
MGAAADIGEVAPARTLVLNASCDCPGTLIMPRSMR